MRGFFSLVCQPVINLFPFKYQRNASGKLLMRLCILFLITLWCKWKLKLLLRFLLSIVGFGFTLRILHVNTCKSGCQFWWCVEILLVCKFLKLSASFEYLVLMCNLSISLEIKIIWLAESYQLVHLVHP